MRDIIVDTKLNVTNYVAIVNSIADGYFNIDGTYQPEYGMINAMRIFYNLCVTGGKFEGEFSHDIIDVLEMEKIICDDDFCFAFNEAIQWNDYSISFGNAFNTALDIVENRKSTLGSVFESIRNLAISITNGLSSIMTEENIKYMSEIGKDVASGKVTTDAIIDFYKRNLEKNNTKQ